ncbi:MAG: heparan-alpha-glucosaminide N-acetyltransferase domain-containing protein [Sandaracinus sp.]
MDAVRGLACVVMIVWHTADAWLTPEIHGTPAFERARLVGGFAAPSFLWLAGLSLALSTELRPTWQRTRQGLLRAGWVLVVGYALKLFAWTVDHGAIREVRCLPTLALAIPAMAALIFAFREPARATVRARAIAGALGAAVLVGTYARVDGLPRSPEVLARLDVLQGIGAALAAMTLLFFGVGRVVPSERARAVVLGLLALAVALATPHVVGVSLAPLPTRVADYVARTTADPAASGARFALFPWLGHTLYGAAIGTILRAAPRDLAAFEVPFVRRPWLLTLACAAVLVAVFEAGPIAPSITAWAEWMRPVLRLVFYGTAAIGSAGVLSLVGRHARPLYDAIATMGRSSLLVYGTHLELAYGLLGVPIRQSLGWGAWAVGMVLLTASMVATARLAEAREAKARRAGEAA